MKITITEKIPSSVQLGKNPTSFKNVKKTIDIPDELIVHTIAVIEELLDRSRQPRKIDGVDKMAEMEKDSRFIDVVFPIFPNGFHQVTAIHRGGTMEIIKNIKWNNYWANLPYKDIPLKRISALKILNNANLAYVGDIPDPSLLEYVEDKAMVLDINSKELKELRKKLVLYQEKLARKPSAKISFQYKNQRGILRIEGCEEISFQKSPAAIINFFSKAFEASNEYKIYADYNSFYANNESLKQLESSEFSKTIKEINERINKETGGLVKKLIAKKVVGKNQANTYKWNENA